MSNLFEFVVTFIMGANLKASETTAYFQVVEKIENNVKTNSFVKKVSRPLILMFLAICSWFLA